MEGQWQCCGDSVSLLVIVFLLFQLETHAHTLHSHTSCGTNVIHWRVSELQGGRGRVCGRPFSSLGPGGRAGAVLGDSSVARGGEDLSAGLLAAAGAAYSPVQPAVGLEGRGAQFVGGRQVRERGGAEAEGGRRGRQRGRR